MFSGVRLTRNWSKMAFQEPAGRDGQLVSLHNAALQLFAEHFWACHFATSFV